MHHHLLAWLGLDFTCVTGAVRCEEMKWQVVFMCFSQPHHCSLLFEKWNINGLFGQVIWLLINISIAPSSFLGLSHKQNCAKRKKGTGSPCLGSRKLPVSSVATGLHGCVLTAVFWVPLLKQGMWVSLTSGRSRDASSGGLRGKGSLNLGVRVPVLKIPIPFGSNTE